MCPPTPQPTPTARAPLVTVVIPIWNSGAWLPGCLDALRRQSLRDFEVVLVDNGSTDGAADDAARRHGELEVIRHERNLGFAAAANAGIRHGRGRYVALLNADTRAEPEWLAELVGCLEAAPPEVAAAASLMLRMEDPERVDDAGDGLSRYGAAAKRGHGRPAAEFAEPAEVLAACAGAALYRRRLFDEIGGFDESFESYLEDVDLGLRARVLGFRCRYVPTARVLHQGHASALGRPRYVTLTTRNRVQLLLKNLPASLLVRHAPRLIWGQLYFLVVNRRPWRSLAGYLGVLPRLAGVWRERRRILGRRRLPVAEIDRALGRTLGEPPLRELWRRRRRRARGARGG